MGKLYIIFGKIIKIIFSHTEQNDKFPNLPSTPLRVLERAVRNCPTSALWIKLLSFHEKARTQIPNITTTFHQAIQNDMTTEEYLNIFNIYLDIRVRDFRQTLEVSRVKSITKHLKGSDDEAKLTSLQELRSIFQWSVEYFNHCT